MPVTAYPITIDHEELEGSPIEGGDGASFKATRLLRCAWADRLVLYGELFTGYEVTVGDAGSTGVITSVMGQEYPHLPGAGIYVSQVSISPWHNQSAAHLGNPRVASWPHAQLTVQYANQNFSPHAATPQIAEETLDPCVEMLQLPNTQAIYLGTSPRVLLPAGQRPGKLVRMQSYTYSLQRVKRIPPGWMSLVGSINSVPYTSHTLGETFAAETLLYNGYKARRCLSASALRVSGAGSQAWNVTLQFTYRPQGWNQFPSGSGGFHSLHDALTGGSLVEPYSQKADFKSELVLA